MEVPHREVLIYDDEGDAAFAKAAPLLVEALQLVAATQAVTATTQLSHHLYELTQDTTLPTYTQRRALDELAAQQSELQHYLTAIQRCFGPVQDGTARSEVVQHRDGTLSPAHVSVPALLQSLPCLDYAVFRERYTRLSAIVATGLLFTACEPRLRVLQSRYALHRAYNGDLEDAGVRVTSGGDGGAACDENNHPPRLDVRRLETCMTADTLLRFISYMGRTEPETVLRHARTTPTDGKPGEALTVRTALQRFAESTKTPLSAEALGLRPNYADTAARQWLELDGLMEGGGVTGDLLHHFLSIHNDTHGELLARLVVADAARPGVTAPCTRHDALELEFTVTGRAPGELAALAEWCARCGLLRRCPRLQVCVRVSQAAYDRTGPSRDATTARCFADVLRHIFAPVWDALLRPEANAALAALLPRLAAFALVFDRTAELQELPQTLEPAMQGHDPAQTCAPPDALVAFAVWREVQLLNCFVAAREQSLRTAAPGGVTSCHTESQQPRHCPLLSGPLRLRLHGGCSGRSLFGEAVLGLLLADDVVNPSHVFDWSPLGYLYYLAQRHVVLTPSRNRVAGATVAAALGTAVSAAVHTGLRVSLATLDPLFYHAAADALGEEMRDVQKNHGLCVTDVAELGLTSIEANALLPLRERRRLFGDAWPRARSHSNTMAATQVHTLRLRHRETARAHEVALLARHAGGFGRLAALQVFFHVPRLQPVGAHDAAAQALRTHHGYRHHEAAMRFPRIVIVGPRPAGPDAAAKELARAMQRRQSYQQHVVHADATSAAWASPDDALVTQVRHSLPAHTPPVRWRMVDGVFDVDSAPAHAALPSWECFQRDVRWLRSLAHRPALQRFASRRLGMLECKFRLHVALTNDDEEGFYVQLTQPTTTTPCTLRCLTVDRLRRGDLYTCVKVDVHCHMAGGMTARALLAYMKRKLQSCPDDVVDVDRATGKPVTLATLMASVLRSPAGGPPTTMVPAAELTIGSLEVLAGNRTFNRFDEFNSRYSPMGVSALRSLFLKTDNFMGGRYFAELIHDVFAAQQREGNTFSEFRLSIYGRHPGEWDALARWFAQHRMSHDTNRWLVQVPRLFALYRRSGTLRNFEEMLHNIFAPLWAASVEPERHPLLNHLLAHVSGFDSVDNESDREPDEVIRTTPRAWTRATNPPYAYYMYYMWSNITTLNRYRAAKGLATFDFRPHGGESGDPDHMADIFLLADGVGHGINLAKRPVLQYLYYLAHIPLAIVPLSNNALFCRYAENPFPVFFRRGLNVALGTDGALMFHHTEQPLLEEYSTAKNFCCLSDADVCELARNSVLMSGFPSARKERWLGKLYRLHSVAGNEVRRSHVPMTRCAFRYEAYMEEVIYLEARAAVSLVNRAMATSLEEELHILDTVGLTRQEVLHRRWHELPMQTDTRLAKPPPRSPTGALHVASSHL